MKTEESIPYGSAKEKERTLEQEEDIIISKAIDILRKRSFRPHQLNDYTDVAKLHTVKYGCVGIEYITVYSLDNQNRVINYNSYSTGSPVQVSLWPRAVIKDAITVDAAAIIIAHNHPGGDPTPSAEDLDMTEKIKKACKVVGIPLLDHVIVAGGEYYSFEKEGRL